LTITGIPWRRRVAKHPSVPAKTLPEFIAYANANPGKLSYGSGGVGGITHITAEQFKQEAGGLDIVHVPYRGVAPPLTDLLAGQIQVVFTNLALLIGYIATGKLRARRAGRRGVPDGR
jgi:tripartite-type tricarboxylate transporter receptor subunit TctC